MKTCIDACKQQAMKLRVSEATSIVDTVRISAELDRLERNHDMSSETVETFQGYWRPQEAFALKSMPWIALSANADVKSEPYEVATETTVPS